MTASASGADISSYQKVWTVEQIAAKDFMFFKAAEGIDIQDANFPANWSNARKAGKPRGAYFFFHPGENLALQVANFAKVLRDNGLVPGDMIVVDCEILADVSSPRTGRNIRPAHDADKKVTAAGLDKLTKAFLDGIRAEVGEHHPLIVYTNHEVGQYLEATAAAYPLLWFAYPSMSAPDAELILPWKHWLFWQWSWSDGLDKDIYVGSSRVLWAFLSKYLPKTRIVVPDVTGLKAKQAIRKLSDAGFRTELDHKVPFLHTSEVLSQSPKAGDKAEEGSVVRVDIKILP